MEKITELADGQLNMVTGGVRTPKEEWIGILKEIMERAIPLKEKDENLKTIYKSAMGDDRLTRDEKLEVGKQFHEFHMICLGIPYRPGQN